MIRVYKRATPPEQLALKGYSDDAVNQAILDDQYDKCYICESKLSPTDYQVEHLVSRHNDPEQVNRWSNLFIACGYCNGKKSDDFDGISSPDTYNVEEEIEQTVDYANSKAIFKTLGESTGKAQTVDLLNRVFNGTDKYRKLREERFFKHFIMTINSFNAMVVDYMLSPTEKLKEAIRDSLSIGNEYLGFKYWIIKENSTLFHDFGDCLTWNKK